MLLFVHGLVLAIAAAACAFPVDIYILDTKICKENLFAGYVNTKNIKYDPLPGHRKLQTQNVAPYLTSAPEQDHGTNIAALILDEIDCLKKEDVEIYDIPIASKMYSGLVADHLLDMALCKLCEKIQQPVAKSRHSVLVLSFSIELKNVRSNENKAMIAKMTSKIRALLERNVHVLVAAGSENVSAKYTWPAAIKGVYSIGGLMAYSFLQRKTLFRHHFYRLYTPSNYDATFYDLACNVQVRRNEGKISIFGTSYANAIAAGKIAAILATVDQPIHPTDTFENLLSKIFIFDFNNQLPMLP